MKADKDRSSKNSSYPKLSIAVGVWTFIGLLGAIYKWWPFSISRAALSMQSPHSLYYLRDPRLLTLHVVSDSVIFLSYLAIAVSLTWLLSRWWREITFAWIFIALAVFVVSCGFAHAMDVVVLWQPLYWLSEDVKLIAAITSLTTAVALPFLFPEMRSWLNLARSSRLNASRFLAMVDGGNDAFYLLESVRSTAGDIVDFRFIFLNVKGQQLVSGANGNVEGQLLCERHPVMRGNNFFDQFKRVVETGERLDLRTPIDEASIKASWLHLLVIKVDDGIAITARNISTQKKREAALTETNAQFQSLVEGVKDHALFTIDAGGMVTSWNFGAERLLGYSKADILGRNFSCFLTPEERGRDLPERPLQQMLLDGGGQDEGWLVAPDRNRFFAHVTITPVLVGPDTPSEFAVMVQDVTTRKLLAVRQEELRREAALLHETFLSHVSHELRTPLTATYFFTTNVLEGLLGDLNPAQHEHLSRACDNLNQLKDMVSDLLDVTSAETYKLRVVPQPVSPGLLIGEVLATCRPDAAVADISLTSIIDPDLRFLWADPIRVRQILVNLIDNALRCTPVHGTVKVGCTVLAQDSNFLCFSITDTGCGIDTGNLEVIFERLVQIDNGIVSSRAGLGLGLFIARELVNQHGGRIWAESQIGQGSTFLFTLPAFSMRKLLAPMLARIDAAATLRLITVDVATAQRDVQRELRSVLEQFAREGRHLLLPSMFGHTQEDTFFIVACVTGDEIVALECALNRELSKFSGGECIPFTCTNIVPLHPGSGSEQQASEMVDEIDRFIQQNIQRKKQLQ